MAMLRRVGVHRRKIGARIAFVRFAGFVQEHAVPIRTCVAAEIGRTVFRGAELSSQCSIAILCAIHSIDACLRILFSLVRDVYADRVWVEDILGLADDDFDDLAILTEELVDA